MTWQTLVIVSVVFASLSTILQRILLRNDKSDPVAYAIFFQIVVGLLIGFIGFATGQMSYPRELSSIILNLILVTIFYGLGSIFLFKSLKQINASVFTVIFSARALFTVFASTLFLSEALVLKQYFGILLILGGIILVSLKAARFNFGKGEAFALLAAVCFGFANTNDRFILKTVDVYPFVSAAFVIPAMFVLILNLNVIPKMGVFLKGNYF